MMLFPKGIVLATKIVKSFPKIVKNQFWYWIFIKKFQKFLKISQQVVFFVQTREKLTHGLFNFFWKICSDNAFLAIFLKFFENFRKFSGVRGAPPKMPPPPNRNPGAAAEYSHFFFANDFASNCPFLSNKVSILYALIDRKLLYNT